MMSFLSTYGDWVAGLLGWVVAFASLATLGWLRLRRRPHDAVRREADLKLFRVGRHDMLTGLISRAVFIDELSTTVLKGAPSALLLIDIDGFSLLNDRHGHRAGDDILVALAARLRALCPNAAHVCRLGADRFGLLAPVSGGLDGVEESVLTVLRHAMAPVACAAGVVDCTASIGVVLLPEQAEDADAALRGAGLALQHVKEGGGAGWRFFDPDRDCAQRQRASLADELRAGLPLGEIRPFYQPIMDLDCGRVVGLEVLARWQHPTRGLLEPDLFIPLAEEINLTGQITQALMRRVIADALDWPAWLYFAFNVSPGQLRELIGMVRNPPCWPEGTLDPHRLEIEVTESALIEDIVVAREVITLLQSRGTRVVLDDFGIGYSNFFHLRELPFDKIKIDRSFVIDMADDPRADACVRAMLALGGSLAIPMVAEGVESADTERRLAALGCRFGQGFLYAEPVPSGEVAALLRNCAGPAQKESTAALHF